MVDGGAANKGDMRSSSSSSSSEIPVGSKMGASTANEAVAAVAAKKKDVTSPGVVVRNVGHVVRVLHAQQLQRHGHEGGDQGIHLDYAQPRTHTPHHNR